MATVIRTEKRQRTAFGKLIKWLFIGFNIFMIFWLVSGAANVSQLNAGNAAERAGYAIGATIGFSMVLGIWMAGVVILGLFVLLTRGDTVIIEETSGVAHAGAGIGQAPATGFTNADEMIARYKQQQQTAVQSAASQPGSPQQGGFGRRR